MREKPRSFLDRLLGLVTEVHPGEGLRALQLSVVVFLLLAAYYVVKPVREELILSTPGGAEFKAYAAGASALVLLALLPLYERFARFLGRARVVPLCGALFFLSTLGFYALLQRPDLPFALGIPFYLWASLFGVVLVAQFWSLMNDLHSSAQGLRLFVVLGLGQSLGAVFGSKLTALLLEGVGPLQPLSVPSLLLVSAGLLFISTVLSLRAVLPLRTPAPGPEDPASDEPQESTLRLVLNHRYLLLLCGLSLLFTLANSNGEYLLGRAVKGVYEELPANAKPGYFAAFYGSYYFYVNLFALLMQGLMVSRVVRRMGVGSAVMALPLFALASSVSIAAFPVLAVIRFCKVFENAVDYSLHNTARQMLWLPTTAAMKYRAKYLVDTVMVRLGDVLSSLFVWGASAALPMLGLGSLSLTGFALTNAVVVLLWLVLSLHLARAHGAQRDVARTPRAADKPIAPALPRAS